MYWLLSFAGALLVACFLTYLLGNVFGRGERLPDVATGPAKEQHWRSLEESPITAETVSGIRFSQSLRGYDAAEVDAFLQRIATHLRDREESNAVENAAAPEARA